MFVFTKIDIHLQKKRLLLNVFILAALLARPAVAQSAGSKPVTAINLNITKTTLYEVIATLKAQSDYDFFYDKEAAKKLIVQNLKITNASVPEVLQKMRQELPVDYQVLRNEVTIRIESQEQHNRRVKQEEPGKISGRVLDDKGETLPGATIKVAEINRTVHAGADGTYLLSLPPGNYTIEVTYISYQTKRITGVTVQAGRNTPLDVLLKTDSKSLSEVVVTSSYRRASIEGLYARQKNSAGMTDGITAEQISRTPDNNTAQVLKRVSGVQISQNKYVVVRGLSDRYNNVYLNDAPLPSSEPNRRDFAFDMIPSALLDNIVVNKTATPDLTGEFTGGLVQVYTKDIPDENFFQINIGSGYNSRATGKDFIGLERSKYAYFGFGDDSYDKPSGMTFKEYIEMLPSFEPASANAEARQKAASFLSSIPVNWKMYRYTAKPIQTYQLSFGRTIPIKDTRFGLVAALTYRNEQEADQDDQYYPTVQDYKGTDYAFTTTLGGSLNMAYAFGKNKFSLKNTYNRKLSDGLYWFNGKDFTGGRGGGRYSYSNTTIIHQMFQSQLGGEHTFTKRNIKLDWNAGIADLDRDQPYNKIMNMYGSDEIENYYAYNFSDLQADMGSLYYSGLKEKMYTWAANVLVPFKLLDLNQTLKLGQQGRYRRADFGYDFFKLRNLRQAGGGGGGDFSGRAYYDVYSPGTFANSLLYLYPISGSGQDAGGISGSGYKGFQRLNAVYAMLDLKPLERLRITGGVRMEKNDQNVHTTQSNQDGVVKDSLVNISKTDWLPSVNTIYSLTPKMNIRAAWYKTVARPDLRELSTFQYYDFTVFRLISGGDLEPTQIQNFDLRFEFYPSPGEIISISGFHKRFFHPIELQLTGTSGKPLLQYKNLESAKDKGIEVDFRKSLNFFSQVSPVWRNLYLSGSFTYVDASVEFQPQISYDPVTGEPVTPRRNRPLYGQSPYIINGGILYTGKHLGFNAVYNRYGKRIVYAYSDMSEDEYENPRDVIDLQLSYKFLKQQRAELRLNVSDLLNQELFQYKNQFGPGNPDYSERMPSVPFYPGQGYELPAGQKDPKGTSYNAYYDVVTGRRQSGTTYSLNFSYRF